MLRRLLPLALAALAAAPVALADGGSAPPAADGVLAPGGEIRYLAIMLGSGTTMVQTIQVGRGSLERARTIPGGWQIPGVAFDGTPGGLTADGRTLVLMKPAATPFRKRSVFQVVRARDLAPLRRVVLKGDFAFDALSPDGSRLYLIQHVSQRDLTRYVVRAYSLGENRLLPGVIADRTQRGWVMAGWPMTRATSADGRWVYTLYTRPGGYPFVHALDAVRGVAHCIGIPWHGKQDVVGRLRMSLRDGGRTLSLHWPSGREYLAITRGTWRISHPGAAAGTGSSSGFPWWIVGVAGGGALLLLVVRQMRYGLRARAATN
jgi:hypothetical protein